MDTGERRTPEPEPARAPGTHGVAPGDAHVYARPARRGLKAGSIIGLAIVVLAVIALVLALAL